MRATLKILSASSLVLSALPAVAALNIFACEPEWGALAQELAGDKASVYSATTALQDPHRIEARPSLIARVRSADLLVCTGADLEIGWLPLLLAQSGNRNIQPGKLGYFEASQFVAKHDVPGVIDRSMGDIHASGNPHVHLDPRNIGRIAAALSERLAQVDPQNVDTYKARGNFFDERWRAALARWELQAAQLKGAGVIVYHKDLSYFIKWAGMREVGSLEPKPGLPPTPSHLAELVERMKSEPARAVLYSAYSSPKAAEFLSARAKIPAVMLPFTVGGSKRAGDLFALFDDTIDRLVRVMK